MFTLVSIQSTGVRFRTDMIVSLPARELSGALTPCQRGSWNSHSLPESTGESRAAPSEPVRSVRSRSSRHRRSSWGALSKMQPFNTSYNYRYSSIVTTPPSRTTHSLSLMSSLQRYLARRSPPPLTTLDHHRALGIVLL